MINVYFKILSVNTQILLILKFTVNVLKYTRVSNKTAYANSADPDQTAPEGAV